MRYFRFQNHVEKRWRKSNRTRMTLSAVGLNTRNIHSSLSALRQTFSTQYAHTNNVSLSSKTPDSIYQLHNKSPMVMRYESILNHLFLPCHLPNSAEADYLLRNDHEKEYILLEYMKAFLKSLNGKFSLPVFSVLITCIERWMNLQSSNKLSAVDAQNIINQLVSGDFLPLYFRHHNAAILIEIESYNDVDRSLISAWQVLLSTKNVTSSLLPHFSCFPVPIFQLQDQTQLRSIAHCELLIDFMNNPFEYSQTQRGSGSFDETRDIPVSHYVTDWWISHFPGIKNAQQNNSSISFKKKHREQIRWKDALLPFRRSGLWMTMKTVLQTILIKRLRKSGTIVYKLLITLFLTHVIYTRQKSMNYPMKDVDLLIHCLRKIARRLNKLEYLKITIEDNDIYLWVDTVIDEINLKLGEIIPNSTWQIPIQRNERPRLKLPAIVSEFDHLKIYQHLCENLKMYLTTQNSYNISQQQFSNNNEHYDSLSIRVQFDDELQFTTVLANASTDNVGIALRIIEIWIETHLEQWMNRLSLSENGKTDFKKLFDFFGTYQKKALEHYYSANQPSDCFGYSRFILSSLTILRQMHQKLCTDPRFKRLSSHTINITNLLELFEYLILPSREEMIRARQLYDYFQEFRQKQYPDLLGSIDCRNAFGIYFASQSIEMRNTLRQIQAEAELDKQAKREEFRMAKQKYDQLMAEANNLQCECEYEDVFHRRTHRFLFKRKCKQCKRCKLYEEANRIRVDIYECPIPEDEQKALAVVFELQMPDEIRYYRDILWQFINRPCPNLSHTEMYEWLHTRPHAGKLSKFYTGFPNCKVKLVSRIKSLTETHYSKGQFSKWTTAEEFLHPNNLTVNISPTKSTTLENDCRILTAQLEHSNYKSLQFSVDNTSPLKQNRVITESIRCPLELKPAEFIEFGSFRLGHRLQWWNLLSALELDSLSFEDESVLLLIIHSLTQYGPITDGINPSIPAWCPESHDHLCDDHFLNELISRLDRRLNDCRSNWQNEMSFLLMTLLTMRVLTLCNSTKTKQVTDLALKCRQIGESSIEKISQIFQTITSINIHETQNLRDKIVIIASACLFTFSIDFDHQLWSDSSIISLLKAVTSIHDNTVLNKRQMCISIFMRNLIRWRDCLLVNIQPSIAQYLKETSYQSLHQFVEMHWGIIKTKQITNGQWKKQIANDFDGCYNGQYESIQILIDCLRGRFSVNGMSISFLPDEITSNELFRRTFDQHIFEVQAAGSPNTYITKHAYHNSQIHYQFYYNRLNRQVIIREARHTGEIFQLLPNKIFQNEFAREFIDNYSHWINQKTNLIEFRSISFQHPQFLFSIPYEFNFNEGLLVTKNMKKIQVLINRSSSFFQNLYKRYFYRLDSDSYLYMFRDNAYSIIRTKQMPLDCLIYIHLPRLGLAFKFDAEKKKIFSREYSDMYIDENQCFGTLTGLKAGLLLSSNSTHHRKFLVPFGTVQAKKTAANDHQSVYIERTESMSFSHQYFVFSLNDRLRLLQSSDSPTGWLYLALLHAMTSHPLPDFYTGMTGMERAFQLLYSAGCWTDQPFDLLSLNIAYQIANISPKVQYYPTHLTCMKNIQWNERSLPYSLQHFGYYLIIENLITASEQLNFMYSLSDSKKSTLPHNNSHLLKKLYWDYRDSYNPTARLSDEMEAEIFSKHSSYSYEPTSISDSIMTDNCIYRPSKDLYASGDLELHDPSKLECFPLNQWNKGNDHFKNLFISFLKLINDAKISVMTDQLAILFSFLHYISKKRSIKPFYLNMLSTILLDSSISMNSIIFPPFISYKNIEQTQFHRQSIQVLSMIDQDKQTKILEEAEESFRQNLPYTDQLKLLADVYLEKQTKEHINNLFKSWQMNEKLRVFIQLIEQQMDSIITYVRINTIKIDRQQFVRDLHDQHYQIRLKSKTIPISSILLYNAYRKYCCYYSDHLCCLTQSPDDKNSKRKQPFPEEVFPSTSDDENSFGGITKFFKQQLMKSWEEFQVEDEFQQNNLSVEEIKQRLHSIRQESASWWKELIRLIRTYDEFLFDTGLTFRMTPSILVSLLHQIWLNEEEQNHQKSFNSTKRQKIDRLINTFLNPEQCILMGGILVNWTIEQQLQRIIHCANQKQWEDFEKELFNTPHVNWIPSEHVPWLILELEMNITIREVQVDVARHMIDPSRLNNNESNGKNIVMQMNMGEGKTSVIVPMLALSLCSSTSSLVRIIVLKSLMTMNYQSLRSKLGGLLNRRVFLFACRRDMNFNLLQINQMFQRLQQGIIRRDIILIAPEYILSFDLLTIDKCRRKEFEVSQSMLNIQCWFKRFARDVLDESDEILHVKYQLIYTIGNQIPVDGGAQRWKMIQLILKLVKENAEDVAQNYSKYVSYEKSLQQSHFPPFRMLSREPFLYLAEKIANDWLNEQSYREEERQLLLSFVLKTNVSIECLNNRFSPDILQRVLILRGLLSSEVLFTALTKRYRVNFGVNFSSRFERRMAVPFRAKDVAAENTEFGHPDIAIVLTQLFYYYDGLTDDQMLDCFKRLSNIEKHPEEIYHEWISYENEHDLDPSIKTWEGINLKDDQQRMIHLFPTFRKNMLVINYYLNYFVFPQEAKQFPEKLISSAWDLSSDHRAKITTGFSGTNDTQLLLPIHIDQRDLPKFMKTNAVVLNNLLREENEFYRSFSISVKTEDLLKQIVNEKQCIQVILDVGALFLNGSNSQIAIQWLEQSNRTQIDYAVYFKSDSLYVSDRHNQHHPFATSPASERLGRCVFYIDEVHTRGTDFKFPIGFRGAVTLGNGLTKDRFVQACMRMRKLGQGHSLSFYSSHEVDQRICMLKKKTHEHEQIKLIDILRWVYENTIQATWNGLHQWAAQSLNFQRKIIAFQNILWVDEQQQQFAEQTMDQLPVDCIEQEILKLDQMYGMSKSMRIIADIHRSRCSRMKLSAEINDIVVKRLDLYGGSKTRLAHSLDEEQERELEREIEQEVEEERQQERPTPPIPHEPFLYEEIKRLSNSQDPMMNLAELTSVFSPLPQSLCGTTFFSQCQPSSWRKNLWITNEFQRVIQTQGDSLDGLLRSPRWLIIYRNEHIIFLSPYEANHLIASLKYSSYRNHQDIQLPSTNLRLLLPRIKRNQSILINTPSLSIPLSHFSISNEQLAQLFLFNGTLYFKDVEEQRTYCHFLGVCPKPRTNDEQKAYGQGRIDNDGFVKNLQHRHCLQMNQYGFSSNPLVFIRKFLESRHRSHIPVRSHVGSIIFDTTKLLS